ncbi:hypothetical protein OSC12_14900, partial [Citrobacter portucalensis]|nr:hypothetical protein [Citrobacter portucalensis]
MNRTDAPAKQPKPFGINGQREPLLTTTPSGDNTASYEQGFPPITMILKSAGGLPPKGQDMNQILYELSALSRWSSAGVLNSYDSSFATSISGYPKGSLLIGDDGKTIYISITDSNLENPNTSSQGWLNLLEYLGLPDLGIAGTGSILPALDWQQFDFVPGARYFIKSSDMSNVPPEIVITQPTFNAVMDVIGYDGITRHVD